MNTEVLMPQPALSSTGENALALARLLQLASSNLPVGGYTFSQGLEYAIDAGWLTDKHQVQAWVEEVTMVTLTYCDLPIIIRQHECWKQQDWQGASYWNQLALASRETNELYLADTAMGDALLRLVNTMSVPLPPKFIHDEDAFSFATLFSFYATHLDIPLDNTCTAYGWSFLESQVIAATKLLPMGQTDSQHMMFGLASSVAESVAEAFHIQDDEIGMSLPGLAMASALHETQYSRLYRS